MQEKKNKTAIILCGGKGTRLGSIGKQVPKTLVKVQGVEILKYILHQLIKYKYNNIILPVGYKGRMIKKMINKNLKFERIVNVVSTGENSSIGKRIALVTKYIKSENTLILNGDAIFNFDMDKVHSSHVKKNFDISFLSAEIIYPYGTIGLVGNKVVDFKRSLKYQALKVKKKNNYTAFNYTGIVLIKSDILSKYKNIFKKFKNFEADLYPILIRKFKSQLFELDSFWHSIDNVKDIIAVNSIKGNKTKFLKVKNMKKKIKL